MKLLRLLAIVPPVFMLGGLPFVDRVTPFVLGMPLVIAWIVFWLLAGVAVMTAIFLTEPPPEP